MRLHKLSQLKTTLFAICRQPGKIAILTHKDPDGDGLAASLALKVILHRAGFTADIVLEAPPLKSLDFLDVNANTLVLKEDMKYETLILIDCHEPERTGKCAILASKANNLIAIDHHEPQQLEHQWYYYIAPEDVSAGAILLKTFSADINKYSAEDRKYVADCLYTTILNDTDGFINNNTNSEVFELCSQLTRLGTIPSDIMEIFMLRNSPAKQRFIGQALSSIEISNAGKVLFMHTNLQQLAENGLTQEATSKITKWVKGSTGVEVMIYAREIGTDLYRLSLRSPVVNCNRICNSFGGGGHDSAAGCTINAPYLEMKQKILTEVTSELQK